ncbi:MAG: arginase, partial [Planctomycetota bacterium]
MKESKASWGELPDARIPPGRAQLRFIGVPMDLGADRRGVDVGPSAVRMAGFAEKARRLGYAVVDGGDVTVPTPESRKVGELKAKYVAEIAESCDELRARVIKALRTNQTPVVAGGDHSIAIGSVAGVSEFHRQRNETIGLLWVDAHADMNTPESSPSGNVHGMPLAVCLGLGPSELTELGGFEPKVGRENVVLLGIRNLDEVEKEIVRRSKVHAFTMRDIDKRGLADVMQEALEYLTHGTAGYHVSFDVDGIDPSVAPGVGTTVRGGLTFREAHLLMEMVADGGDALSFEVTEINPLLDRRNETAQVAVDL